MIYKVLSALVPVLILVVWYQYIRIDTLEESVTQYRAVEKENLEAVARLREQIKKTEVVVTKVEKQEKEIDHRGSEVVKSVETSSDWGDALVPNDVSVRLREYSSKD